MSNKEKDSIISIEVDDHNTGIGPEDHALLQELKNLAIKRTFDIKAFAPKVAKRVLFLKDIQAKHDELEKKFLEEKSTLEAKYDDLYKPFFAKRYEIVNGVAETETEKGVPNFWLIAMKTNEMLANEITERDENALKYLKDIRSCRVENNSRNFKLEFLFDSNPYFKNSVLSKTYYVTDDRDGPVLDKVMGTDIEWCPGKCLTHKVVVKKRPKKGSKKLNNIPMTKTENCESFFNFFKPPEMPEIDEVEDYDDFDTDMSQELQNLMDQDYDIAVTIRDKLIPNAVLWFTGEALVDEDEYNDDDDDDEKND